MDSEFTPSQVQDLHKSGLEPEAIKACVFSSRDPEELKRLLNLDYDGPTSGLVFQYHDLHDRGQVNSCRIKPDTPFNIKGKSVKYMQPRGVETRIYVPITNRQEQLFDKDVPLLITEGEKKSLKASIEGYCAVAAPGVSNFFDKSTSEEAGRDVLKHELLALNVGRGRVNYICLDANKTENRKVLKAELRLARSLKAEGIEVKLAHIPQLSEYEDTGLDDFLVAQRKDGLDTLLDSAWTFPIAVELKKFTKETFSWGTRSLAMEYYLSNDDEEEKEDILTEFDKLGVTEKDIAKYDIQRKNKLEMKAALSGRMVGEELRGHLNQRRISSIADLGMPRSKYIANVVVATLRRIGKFIFDGSLTWYLNNSSKRIDLVEPGTFDIILYQIFDINPTASEYKAVLSEIDLRARIEGLHVPIRKQSFFCAKTHTLYKFNGNFEVYKITEAGYSIVSNGTDDVYFVEDEGYQQFKRLARYEKDFMFKVFRTFNLDTTRLSAWQTYIIIKMFIYYGMFYVDRRPIIHVKGEFGASKTTLARIIVKMIKGPLGEVSADFGNANDVKAKLKNSSIMCWDNVESMSDETINILCSVATGTEIEARKLFSNGELIKFRPACILMMTSISTFFLHKRPDFQDRILAIPLNRIAVKRTEQEIYEIADAGRDHFWTQFVAECPEMLRNLRKERTQDWFHCKARMADFYTMIARITDDPQMISRIVDGIVFDQAESALENSLWFQSMMFILDSREGGLYEGKCNKILDDISKVAALQFKGKVEMNVNMFGKLLASQKNNLAHYFDMEIVNRQNSNYYKFRLKPQVKRIDEGVSDGPPLQSHLLECPSPLEFDVESGGGGYISSKSQKKENSYTSFTDLKAVAEAVNPPPSHQPPATPPVEVGGAGVGDNASLTSLLMQIHSFPSALAQLESQSELPRFSIAYEDLSK